MDRQEEHGMEWGLLTPERLPGTRRTRSLGLAGAVRHYNELAVPGMGNVWFVRQVYLALLGVVVATQVRDHGRVVSNIEVSNAIEALGCWLALRDNGGVPEARLRGSTKLPGRSDISFAALRRRSAYVTQPMRMATVQVLPALGLVEAASERFNAYVPTAIGRAFVDAAAAGIRPWRRDVVDHLVEWVGGDNRVATPQCRKALSPLESTPAAARKLLRDQILAHGEGAPRRRAIIAWVSRLRRSPPARALSWRNPPDEIDPGHWCDLEAGGRFFGARDEAVALLERLEARLDQVGPALGLAPSAWAGKELQARVATLQERCRTFLQTGPDNSPGGQAGAFCRECLQPSPADVIRALVARDGQVLRLSQDRIRPGPAFRSGASLAAASDGRAAAEAGAIRWPEGMSRRVENLFYLGMDLDGVLASGRARSRRPEEADDER